ncbi:MAG: exosortase/archaeosortase family protein [Bryobacteraceae bacterium]
MISSPIVRPAEAPQQPWAQPPRVLWLPIVWFGALLIACYAPMLFQLVKIWASDDNMGHGFFVPAVAGYVVWQRRAQLLAEPRKSSGWGLLIMACGAVQSVLATLGAELFTQRLAFVISLTGMVVYLGGKRWFKILAFPLSLLLFMIPIPAIIYAQLTLRLQELATILAEWMLTAVGIPVIRTGNLLELPSQVLNVAEACSGIRSLLSLSFLSLVYAYFRDNRTWVRWVLFLSTIPIAIGANAIRVALTGVFSEVNTKLAQGAYHEVEGYIVFVIALVALISFHKLINLATRKRGAASLQPRSPIV